MKKIIAFFLIALVSFSSCEKDDICDPNTSTTPRVVIDFYNINIPSVKKNVTNLKVIGLGKSEAIQFNTNSTDENQYLTNGSTISIPLRTDSNATTYTFIHNSGNTNTALVDTDEITFNYTREDIYVSRACGFKTLFTLLSTSALQHTAVPASKTSWMQAISIEKTKIANENETHIKVYF